MKSYFFLILLTMVVFGSLSLVNAETFGYGRTESVPINYSLIPTVNNSQFLQGLTPQQVADLFDASGYLPLAGGTMAGDINMGNNNITNLNWVNGFDYINGSGNIETTGDITGNVLHTNNNLFFDVTDDTQISYTTDTDYYTFYAQDDIARLVIKDGINNADAITVGQVATGYVPYTGATTNVDLGVFDITTTGTGTFTTLNVTGGATFNSFGGDNDFLIKANNVDNQFRIDAGTNTVNIGDVTPSAAYTWHGEGRTGAGGGGTADDGGGMRFDAGVGYSYTSGAFSTAGDGGRINFYAGTGGAVSGNIIGAFGGPGGEARMTSGDGGASSGNAMITQQGGNAGDFYFYSGDGGKGTNSVGTSTGGQAGDFQLVAGGGGDADGTGTVNRGGAGAEIFFTAGAGGDATNGATSNTGGAGGDITFTAGRRGTGATANGAEGKISFATGGSTRWTIDGNGHLLAGTDGTGAYNIATAGNIYNKADNSKHYFGESDDASIHYNGTDMIINPKEVGSGKIIIDGDLIVTGSISAGDGYTGSCVNTTFINGIATGCND